MNRIFWAALMTAFLATGAHAAPGDLDASFGGGDGWVSTPPALRASRDDANSVIQQADGKLVAAGYSISSNHDFVLVRYNSDGSLDTSFDGDGKLTTDINASDDVAQSVIQQADGKLVAAGYSYNGSDNDFAVVRYNSDGSLDTTFNGTGKLTADFGDSDDITQSLIQQTDGKLVVAGNSYIGSDINFTLVRYNSDGSLDMSLDGDGKLVIAVLNLVVSVIQQADGKLVVAGNSYNGSNQDFALVRYNSDGSLDTSFDGDGKLTTAIGSGDDYARSVIQQADGKLVMAGNSYNGGNQDFALVRYNSDGSLDVTFSGDGKLTTAVSLSNDYSAAVIQQMDGRLVLAGSIGNGSGINDDFALVRYNSDGSLDATFSGDGKLTTAVSLSNDYARSVIQQTDGRLVVAGYNQNGTTSDFALVRYNSNGSLDATFDSDGKLMTNIAEASEAEAYSMVRQADGKLVAVGYSDNGSNLDFALVRYNSDGSLDSTFDGDGKLTTAIGIGSDWAHSVIQQADGKLVVAGRSDNGSDDDFALVRYNSDGSLDVSFDGDGKLTTDIGAWDVAYSVIQQSDGKLVAAGNNTGGNSDFVLVRYNSDGSLDATFNGTGKLTTAIGAAQDGVQSVIQQADGKLVVAGHSSGDFALARYNPDGSLDITFDSDGKLTTAVGTNYSYAYSVIQQVDGKLVVAGYSYIGSSNDFALVRYNSDGSLDTTFSGDGKLTTTNGVAYSVIQQADGKLVAAGYSGNDSKLVRYNSDGSLDASLDGDGKLATIIGASAAGARSVIQSPDGKLVIVGVSYGMPYGQEFIVARFESGQSDVDGDGYVEGLDNCASVTNSDQLNTDGDAQGDACDVDDDGDGVTDASDNCPLNVSANQMNNDGDAQGDICDPDDDNDSVADLSDNCPLNANANQLDWDGDGNGDRCDDAVPLPDDIAGDLRKERAGAAVAFAGDFNDDGYGDYVVGITGYDVPASSDNELIKDAGRASVISGKDGTEIVSIDGKAAGDAMGFSVAGDFDFNADGFIDVVIGSPLADDTGSDFKDCGSTTVLWGPDGIARTVIYGQQPNSLSGYSLATTDKDRDGYTSIIIGAPKHDSYISYPVIYRDAGSVTVYSHFYGRMNTYYGTRNKAHAGMAVAVGDVDNNGLTDIIVGAPNDHDSDHHISNSGSVSVYHVGAIPPLIMKKYGETSGARFGASLAAADTDGDNTAEIIVGAPLDDYTQKNRINSGSVTIFSGSSGSQLFKEYGPRAKTSLGNSLAAGDVDGDGFVDVVIGAWKDDAPTLPRATRDAGSVSIYSGNGFNFIHTLYGDHAKDYLGAAVSSGDINSDGQDDLIIGIPGFDLPATPTTKAIKDAGAVHVVSGAAL